MINRTDEMTNLTAQDRNELIAAGEADGKVHDLRPVLQEKLKFRSLLARDIKPAT